MSKVNSIFLKLYCYFNITNSKKCIVILIVLKPCFYMKSFKTVVSKNLMLLEIIIFWYFIFKSCNNHLNIHTFLSIFLLFSNQSPMRPKKLSTFKNKLTKIQLFNKARSFFLLSFLANEIDWF